MQFDLVSAIRESIARSSVSWSPQHVYGHLHKTLLFQELTWWEQKNLEVDGLAVEFCREIEANHQLVAPNPWFFTELAALFVVDSKQSRLDNQLIQEHVALPSLQERWCEKLLEIGSGGHQTACLRPNRLTKLWPNKP
ncbi:unnamed protein product [Cylindrotheca closterium]|uniref:Uncharacterized protein n=1 Tax=Cylindrotheca closterium TaxID=2856 RepID=A0AAD2CDN2_9STRA|nr:unnamed protein product [Cylindrotheca closterium]